MFIMYMKERKAWILFFIGLQIWLNILLTLDIAFQEVAILYINLVYMIAFLLFIWWRYRKETAYYKELEESATFDSLPKGESSFEKKITSIMEELILVNNEELNQLKVVHLEENDRILSWIHEVKTPLTGMKLLMDAVQEQPLQEKLEVEWLRIHLLLDQQLHHTRLPSLEKDYLVESVPLQKLLHKEIIELQAWCMQKGIGFEIELLQEEVLTDQKWLAFILRQLLTNAVKYSDSDKEIHVFSKKDEAGHTILTVKDFGSGITKADLPRIFEKSFTGTTGRNTAASTGMGLYLTKKVADKLGIRIIVNSKIDEGSSFSLQFPLKNEISKITSR
ncbi:HAMP domain-containing histidine kinase [Psychrobacillus lasiicapitis]|uniref:histidine kinase n=3 Tax=Psychrobacillus lasiicapitis TaxID=1636719 RepID=A0A544TCL8_9BACI|nr:HAMP domain-containing histidine kinase [Psychrobacillus lasiicapitis]GGA44465.1 sensor protein BceS [Psychrobacillus lasiicapitis]